MKIALGADHAGFALKDEILEALRQAGYQVADFGTNSPEPADYPDFAFAVAEYIASGSADRGILVCGSGVGMSIAANKVSGIRAALGVNAEEVRLTRLHNDANVLTLGARFIDVSTAKDLVLIFLETPFEGGRHERRVGKITQIEEGERKI